MAARSDHHVARLGPRLPERVTDDGAFTTVWSKVSGPGTVTFANATALATTATFSAAGGYILALTANDGW